MPMMPPHRCACGRLVVGACQDCATARRNRADATRNTKHYRKLYRTHRWKLASQRNLARNPWCAGFPSGFHGADRVLAQCTDHIRPAHLHPERFFDEANHQSLCFDCNTRKGQAEGEPVRENKQWQRSNP